MSFSKEWLINRHPIKIIINWNNHAHITLKAVSVADSHKIIKIRGNGHLLLLLLLIFLKINLMDWFKLKDLNCQVKNIMLGHNLIKIILTKIWFTKMTYSKQQDLKWINNYMNLRKNHRDQEIDTYKALYIYNNKFLFWIKWLKTKLVSTPIVPRKWKNQGNTSTNKQKSITKTYLKIRSINNSKYII